MTRSPLALAVLIAAFVASTPAQAAPLTFTVTKTADAVDGSCFPTNCSLRDAVDAANATADTDTIVIPAGHYTLTGAAGDDANVSGDLDITKPVNIVGAGAASTTIDGAAGDRIFDGHNPTTVLSITGLTLTNGKATSGAAVLSEGPLTLDGVTVTGNHADGAGATGVVGLLPPSGVTSLTIKNSVVSSNVVQGSSNNYGAVYMQTPANATLTVTDTQFLSNSVGQSPAPNGYGTLFALIGGAGTVDLTHVRFSANHVGDGSGTTGYGGGLFLQSAGGTITMTDASFDGNTAGGGTGAAGGFGGGAFMQTGNSSTVKITGTTFGSNFAKGYGGGIFLQQGTSSVFDLINDTFSGNVATNDVSAIGYGGAVFLQAGAGSSATLTNDTISSNTAMPPGGTGGGGGLFVQGVTPTASDTIVSGNLLGGAANNCFAALTSAGHNIEQGTTCGLTQPTDITADPLLAPLGDYGGPTQTRAPLPGSPAIDRGASCVASDQRGLARPFGAACDIGAYEFAPPTATTGGAGSLTSTSAVLSGTVLPNLRPTTFRFDFGPTTAYGSKSSTGDVGSGPAVSSMVTGLKPGTTYHYRVVASGDDTVFGADRTFTTPSVAPTLRRLKLSPSTFPAAPRGASITARRRTGTTVSYTASDASTTTFRVLRPAAGRRQGKSCRKPSARNRRGKKCTRYVALRGSFKHKDKVGRNKLHFSGRLNRHKLAPGKYRLTATPRAHGKKGKSLKANFKIVP